MATDSYNYNRSSSSYSNIFYNLSAPPLHLLFFIFTLFSILGLSWYISYESVFEDFMSQLKLFLMLSPLLLLLLVHLFSAGDGDWWFALPWPNRDSVHRAGGSPWGVALLLVVLLFMLSYQSSFQERWFPIYRR